jgi:asparagine synthetase B (glutamine-hydrolysing)
VQSESTLCVYASLPAKLPEIGGNQPVLQISNQQPCTTLVKSGPHFGSTRPLFSVASDPCLSVTGMSAASYMSSLLRPALARVLREGTSTGSNLIAFSGGVDSSLVAALLHEAFPGQAYACIGKSEVRARRQSAR